LPIELSELTYTCKDNSLQLNWATATENNNDYFTIEKSMDALNFVEIGTVKGAGNSNTELNYEFTDVNLQKDVSYYRIKQTDFDDTFTYSSLISPTKCKPIFDFQFEIFPNPSATDLNIKSSVLNTKIVVLDFLGKIIFESNIETGNIVLDVSQFESGIYFVQMISEGETQSKKFIKN
jgi:hypothetical protein